MEDVLWEALVSNVSDARPVLCASLLPGLSSSSRQVLDSALKAGHRKDDSGPLSAFSPVSCLKSNSQSRPGPAVSFCTLIFPRDLRDRVLAMCCSHRSKNNYKYRRRNKSGGDTASDSASDCDAYWLKRRQNILQSLEAREAQQTNTCSGSGSNSSSSCGSSVTRDTGLVTSGLCTCKHLHCPRCRNSPRPASPAPDQFSCQHQGTAQTKQFAHSTISVYPWIMHPAPQLQLAANTISNEKKR